MAKYINGLKKAREDRMMSKAELARKAGLSVLTVDRVERNESCRHSTKRKLLEALGVSLSSDERYVIFPSEEEEGNDSPPALQAALA